MKTEALEIAEIQEVEASAPPTDEMIAVDADDLIDAIDREAAIRRREDAERFYDTVIMGISIVSRDCTGCETAVAEKERRREEALLIAARSAVVAAREEYYSVCPNDH